MTLFVCGIAVVFSACNQRKVAPGESGRVYFFVDRIHTSRLDRVDLLLVIDNSASMADEHALLSDAIPALVDTLVNPPCVDVHGDRTRAASATDPCPRAATRVSPSDLDVHVGIVTSSLTTGDGGCVSVSDDLASVQRIDNGRLLGSLQRAGAIEPGFLHWNPYGDVSALGEAVRTQVESAGESGCGYSAPMEAWYHFLVDPAPWTDVEVVDCDGEVPGSGNCRRPEVVENDDGTRGDPVILAQRAAFLRPDSLVAIVMVSDQNDCSLRLDAPLGHLFADEDEPNLRCFDQSRRFGVDYLYPTDRYVNALTRPELGTCRADLDPEGCDEADRVPNPLYAGEHGPPRDTSLVYLVGIVGVPWQLVRADVDENALPYPSRELHYMTNVQLADPSSGATGWDLIVGEPSLRDPHMLEAISGEGHPTRPGLPTASTPGSDAIHGHDWTSSTGDTLQYACISQVAEPRDCDGFEFVDDRAACDCRNAGAANYGEANPVCYFNGGYSSVQVAAGAYPGLRQLETLRDLGRVSSSAIVGSICARNVSDPTAQDFAFNPVLEPILERLDDGADSACLASELPLLEVDGARRGPPTCHVVEATPAREDCACEPSAARVRVDETMATVVRSRLRDQGACDDATCDAICLCEMLPAGGAVTDEGKVVVENMDAYAACQTDRWASVDGWCYVDEDVAVITGDPALEALKDERVAHCSPRGKRDVFFSGARGRPRSGSAVFSLCRGDRPEDASPADAAVP